MPKFVQYGDRRMELPDGMTLEQAKEVMKRYFPELGDPVVKNEKQGDDTVYVFSKRAGRKGRGLVRKAHNVHAQVIRRLQSVKPATPVPTWAVQVVEMFDTSFLSSVIQTHSAEEVVEGLTSEAARVGATVAALRDMPGMPSRAGDVLL